MPMPKNDLSWARKAAGALLGTTPRQWRARRITHTRARYSQLFVTFLSKGLEKKTSIFVLCFSHGTC